MTPPLDHRMERTVSPHGMLEKIAERRRNHEMQVRHFKYGADVPTLVVAYGLTESEVRTVLRATPKYVKQSGKKPSRRVRVAKARRNALRAHYPPRCDVAYCREPAVMDDGCSRQNRCKYHGDVPQVVLPPLTEKQRRVGRWVTRYPVTPDGTPINWRQSHA